MISIIAAIDQNNAIGLNNRLLCHLPNDLKNFKQITSGHSVIMGRCTYESLPVKPLPNRNNIIVSKSFTGNLPAGCNLTRSIEEAVELCNNEKECFVIGGAQIYRQMLPLAQKLYITRVQDSFQADAWFPEINDSEWQLQSIVHNKPDDKHACAYSFEVYTRVENSVANLIDQITAWIIEKTQGKGVVIGMSGGIDCSVVACLCRLANVDVHLVMMPYGDDMRNTKSLNHAMELIEKFNFVYHIFDIKPAVDALTIPLESIDCSKKSSTNIKLAHANIRPRVRMSYLYQFAQINSRLVAGTGNLAERTVGYFTKWGDGACDLNPIAMLTKKEVYALAQFLEIPDSIINKKPSAGLWEGQTDEEELGITYEQIDSYITNGTTGTPETDSMIENRIKMAEHKNNKIPYFLKKNCNC